MVTPIPATPPSPSPSVASGSTNPLFPSRSTDDLHSLPSTSSTPSSDHEPEHEPEHDNYPSDWSSPSSGDSDSASEDEDEEEAGFDMLNSREFAPPSEASSAGYSRSSGAGASDASAAGRMKLSYPDPMDSVEDVGGAPAGEGAGSGSPFSASPVSQLDLDASVRLDSEGEGEGVEGDLEASTLLSDAGEGDYSLLLDAPRTSSSSSAAVAPSPPRESFSPSTPPPASPTLDLDLHLAEETPHARKPSLTSPLLRAQNMGGDGDVGPVVVASAAGKGVDKKVGEWVRSTSTSRLATASAGTGEDRNKSKGVSKDNTPTASILVDSAATLAASSLQSSQATVVAAVPAATPAPPIVSSEKRPTSTAGEKTSLPPAAPPVSSRRRAAPLALAALAALVAAGAASGWIDLPFGLAGQDRAPGLALRSMAGGGAEGGVVPVKERDTASVGQVEVQQGRAATAEPVAASSATEDALADVTPTPSTSLPAVEHPATSSPPASTSDAAPTASSSAPAATALAPTDAHAPRLDPPSSPAPQRPSLFGSFKERKSCACGGEAKKRGGCREREREREAHLPKPPKRRHSHGSAAHVDDASKRARKRTPPRALPAGNGGGDVSMRQKVFASLPAPPLDDSEADTLAADALAALQSHLAYLTTATGQTSRRLSRRASALIDRLTRLAPSDLAAALDARLLDLSNLQPQMKLSTAQKRRLRHAHEAARKLARALQDEGGRRAAASSSALAAHVSAAQASVGRLVAQLEGALNPAKKQVERRVRDAKGGAERHLARAQRTVGWWKRVGLVKGAEEVREKVERKRRRREERRARKEGKEKGRK
ncbi:hypothetical protein JCM10207_000036 [Rhodosporidiobolus poonsookiae]